MTDHPAPTAAAIQQLAAAIHTAFTTKQIRQLHEDAVNEQDAVTHRDPWIYLVDALFIAGWPRDGQLQPTALDEIRAQYDTARDALKTRAAPPAESAAERPTTTGEDEPVTEMAGTLSACDTLPEHLRGDGPCGDCGADNICWFTENVVWNRVMGGSAAMDDPGGIVCIRCFIRRVDAAGLVPTGWRLLADWPWRERVEQSLTGWEREMLDQHPNDQRSTVIQTETKYNVRYRHPHNGRWNVVEDLTSSDRPDLDKWRSSGWDYEDMHVVRRTEVAYADGGQYTGAWLPPPPAAAVRADAKRHTDPLHLAARIQETDHG